MIYTNGVTMQIKNKKGEVLSIVEAETLQAADLRYSNLYEAQLAQANLSEADLCWANLCWADLRGADLRGANLEFVNFRYADLTGADLTGASLRFADLSRATIEGVKLPDGVIHLKEMSTQVVIIYDRILVGVDCYHIEDWEAISDEEIAETTGVDALNFWHANKQNILAIAKSAQAKFSEAA